MGRSSATLNGDENEALALDHSSMNKFEDSSDDNYKSVSREILKMAAGSREMMKSRKLGKRKSIREAVPFKRDR